MPRGSIGDRAPSLSGRSICQQSILNSSVAPPGIGPRRAGRRRCVAGAAISIVSPTPMLRNRHCQAGITPPSGNVAGSPRSYELSNVGPVDEGAGVMDRHRVVTVGCAPVPSPATRRHSTPPGEPAATRRFAWRQRERGGMLRVVPRRVLRAVRRGTLRASAAAARRSARRAPRSGPFRRGSSGQAAWSRGARRLPGARARPAPARRVVAGRDPERVEMHPALHDRAQQQHHHRRRRSRSSRSARRCRAAPACSSRRHAPPVASPILPATKLPTAVM